LSRLGDMDMAIRCFSFIAVILRPYVQQTISEAGWKMLLRSARSCAFDGEIMAFGAMNGTDADNTINSLVRAGYKGPSDPHDCDMAVFDMGFGAMPPWLERVEVRHFNDPNVVDAAWKLKDSEVYTLHDFRDQPSRPTKGYEVDWPPFIGRISG
jgi:hypothetical protein